MANQGVDVQIGAKSSKTDLFNLNLHRSRSYIHCKGNAVYSLILTDALLIEDHLSYFDLRFYNCREKCLDPNKKSKDLIKRKKSRTKLAECKHKLFFKSCTSSCNSGRLIRIFRPEKTISNATDNIRYDGVYTIKSFTDSADGLSRVFRFVYSDTDALIHPPIASNLTLRTIYKNLENRNSEDEDVHLISAQFIKFNLNSVNVKQEPEVTYLGESVSDAEKSFQEASRTLSLKNSVENISEKTRINHGSKTNCNEEFRSPDASNSVEIISKTTSTDHISGSRPSIAHQLRQVAQIPSLKTSNSDLTSRSSNDEDEDSDDSIPYEEVRIGGHGYAGTIRILKTNKHNIFNDCKLGNYEDDLEFLEVCHEDYIEQPNNGNLDSSDPLGDSEDIDDKTQLLLPNVIDYDIPIKSELNVAEEETTELFQGFHLEQPIKAELDELKETETEQVEEPETLEDRFFCRPRENIIEDIEQEVRNDDIICSLSSKSNVIIVVKQLNPSTKDHLLKIVRLKNCFRNFLNSLIYFKGKMASTPPRSLFNVYSKEDSPEQEITLDDIAVFDDIPFQCDMNHEEQCSKEQCLYNLKFGTIMNIVANKESCPCTWEKEYPKLLAEMNSLAEYVFFGKDNGKSKLVRCAQSSSHFIGLIKKMVDNGTDYKFVPKRRKIEKSPAEMNKEEWEEPHIKMFHRDEINGITGEKTFEEITEELLMEIQKIITTPMLKENHPDCKKSNSVKTSVIPPSEISSFHWSEPSPVPPLHSFRGFERKYISASRLKFYKKVRTRHLFPIYQRPQKLRKTN